LGFSLSYASEALILIEVPITIIVGNEAQNFSPFGSEIIFNESEEFTANT
jgi:hypothetical protein